MITASLNLNNKNSKLYFASAFWSVVGLEMAHELDRGYGFHQVVGVSWDRYNRLINEEQELLGFNIHCLVVNVGDAHESELFSSLKKVNSARFGDDFRIAFVSHDWSQFEAIHRVWGQGNELNWVTFVEKAAKKSASRAAV